MTKKRWITAVMFGFALISGVELVGQAHANGITKCKDENGKWHYGDYAAQACTRSKITTMNEQGIKVKEQDAALSREEMRAVREARERKKKAEQQAADDRARDRRLLLTYENASSIGDARDSRVEAVERYLRYDQEFLKRLQDQLVDVHARLERSPKNAAALSDMKVTEEQITAYEKSIATRQAERKEIVDRFNAEIERYKQIRESQTTADTETLN